MNYKNYNDYEIFYLIEEKDQDAYDLLFLKYKPIINKYAIKYYNLYKNIGISLDDLVQEGNIGLFNAISRYKKDNSNLFWTYANVCIKGNIINYLKKYNSKKNVSFNLAISLQQELEDNYQLEDIISNSPNCSEYVYLEENINKIINYKNNLNSINSSIFELKYNNFSIDEISILLDINKKKVENSLYQSRKRFIDWTVDI